MKELKVKEQELSLLDTFTELSKLGVQVNLPTLTQWVKLYNLGSKPKGRWIVNKSKLEKFIQEKFETKTILKFKG